MMEPTIDGWKAEMVGDDIAWIEFDENHQARVVNPEAGLFGVAPGTGYSTNPNAMKAIAKGNTIFTNVALTDDGSVWWEGKTDEVPAHLIDWTGKDWTPSLAARQLTRTPASAPRIPGGYARSRVLRPEGVPLSAIVLGGRRKTTVPLVSGVRQLGAGACSAPSPCPRRPPRPLRAPSA